jgi:hypothetical protein
MNRTGAMTRLDRSGNTKVLDTDRVNVGGARAATHGRV